MKACSNLAILDLMRRHGVVVDTVSAGEIHRALTAGFQPGPAKDATASPEIMFTADVFDRAALELVARHDISVNCGSPDMIDQYGEVCPGRGITLRINPGFGHGHSQKTNTGGDSSKHGIWHEDLDACLARAAKYDLTITGLHMHIGSGTDMEHLSKVCSAMARTASAVGASKIGASLTTISAGGGLPVAYRDDEPSIDITAYYNLWNQTRQQLADQFGHPVHLEIEPGRFLVAESGSLITEIRAVKQMGENLFYLVDAGFNNLARPILYGAYHPMAICKQRGRRSEVGGQGVATKQVVVGGPLCESGDIFTQQDGGFIAHRELPEAQVGDLLVIGCAGAYGQVMASNYNSKPIAPEVLIENGKTHLIRARQTLDDLIAGEEIPSAE
jgi:diaminopimelate decarboxylase